MASPRVLLLGPPGAGKGTQAGRIADRFDVAHVTTGDALRSNKEMDISHLATEYDTPGEYMDQGDLVPDAVVDEIVERALDEADGFALDGYPRNADQADALDSMTDLDAIIALDVPREVLVERLTGRRVCADCGRNFHVDFDPPADAGVCDGCGGEVVQREDDQPDAVRNRLEVFEETTAPVIDRYSERDAFRTIDGDRSPDAVWDDLQATIESAIAVSEEQR
ncbi:MAG: adenylate kinase [Halococcoides sp.]